MIPGSVTWFRMFLASRWAKLPSEIDSIPVSEFLELYHFWKQFKWGVTDDILSQQTRLFYVSKTGKQDVEASQFKDSAVAASGSILRRITRASLDTVRHGFLMMASVIGKKE